MCSAGDFPPYEASDLGRPTSVQVNALATAGAIAAQVLEVGPVDLTTVERCVTTPVIGLALVVAESDPEWRDRWAAAGSDWMARADVLRETILWVLRPEATKS